MSNYADEQIKFSLIYKARERKDTKLSHDEYLDLNIYI